MDKLFVFQRPTYNGDTKSLPNTDKERPKYQVSLL